MDDACKNFMTPAEIARKVYRSLDEEDVDALVAITDQADLIKFHHSTGRYIRNSYDLWDAKNPFTQPPAHPDDVSMEIIEMVWEMARGAQSTKVAAISDTLEQDGWPAALEKIVDECNVPKSLVEQALSKGKLTGVELSAVYERTNDLAKPEVVPPMVHTNIVSETPAPASLPMSFRSELIQLLKQHGKDLDVGIDATVLAEAVIEDMKVLRSTLHDLKRMGRLS